MKKILIGPALAMLVVGMSACSKTADTGNVSAVESNTVIEETDTNLSAVDGVATDNSADLGNELDNGATGNAL